MLNYVMCSVKEIKLTSYIPNMLDNNLIIIGHNLSVTNKPVSNHIFKALAIVRLSVLVSVCLCVSLFYFEVLFKCLFAPIS